MKILLLEDNPGDARMVGLYLAETGKSFDILPIERLDTALDRLSTDHYDAILLDLGLPDSSGLDTLISAHAAAPDTPIIVLTSIDDDAIAYQALGYGAQDYLVKGAFDGNILERSLRYSIERKKVEQKLLQAQEELVRERDMIKRYLDVSGTMFVAINADQTVGLINRRGCEILGCGEDEVLGRNWFDDFLPPNISGEVKKAFLQLMAGERQPVEYYENPVITSSGETRIIAWHNTVLRDEAGNITGTLSSGEDVTERKQLEESLKHSEEMYRDLYENAPNANFSIGTDGYIRRCNNKAAQMLGYSKKELEGMSVFDLYPDISEGKKKAAAIFRRFVSGEPVEGEELQMQKADGGTIWVRQSVNAIRDLRGAVTESRSTVEDISEQKRADTAIGESASKFQAVAQSAKDAIISVNSQGVVIFWNDASTEIFGYSADEAVGRPLDRIMPERFRESFKASFKAAVSGGRPSPDGRQIETVGLTRDGREVPLELTLSSWKVSGEVYFTAIIRDISIRRQQEEKLKQRTEDIYLINRLNEAVNRGFDLSEIFRLVASETRDVFNSHGAMFYLMSDDRKYLELQMPQLPVWLNKVEKIIGGRLDRLDLRIPLTEESLYRKMLENNKPVLTNDAETIKSMMAEFTESKPFNYLIPKIFRVLDIASVISVPLIYQEKPIGLLDVSFREPSAEFDLKRLQGLAEQMTIILGRKLAEDKASRQAELLAESNEELAALYAVSSVISNEISMAELLQRSMMAITSIKLFNVKKKVGVFLVEGDNMKLYSVYGDGHTEEFLDLHKGMKIGDCLCGLAAETGEIVVSGNAVTDDRHSFCYQGMQPHGHVIVPLKVVDRVVGVLYLYTPANAEISQRKIELLYTLGNQLGTAIDNARLYNEARELSLHDPLTGLANRNLMHTEMDKSFAMARRTGRPFSLIMLDLDHFKKYNDTYGHTAGDNLLVDIARVTTDEVREIDLVARFGGEEFLLILPETELDRAVEVADRIRRRVESTDFFYSNEQPPSHITISLGVAMYEDDVDTTDLLITRADNALYEAKYKGRNRVEVSSSNNNKVTNHG